MTDIVDSEITKYSRACETDFVTESGLQTRFVSLAAASQPRALIEQMNKPLFRIYKTIAPLVRDTLLANGFGQTLDKNWTIQWSGCKLPLDCYRNLLHNQRVNHFPGSEEMTRKDRMWVHYKKAREKFGKMFDFVPETFVLPLEFEIFKKTHAIHPEWVWICKPNSLSRGRGIFLFRDINHLKVESDHLYVISRYIETPYLIQELKFDLRVYVLVASYDPLRIYVYREGLTRFASSSFRLTNESDLENNYKHLTNYAINKNSCKYVENRSLNADHTGHKWSISALKKHLEFTGVPTKQLFHQIDDLIVKTVLVSQKSVDVRLAKHHCFELFGFDILIDHTLKPWLLEVNLSPSLGTDSPLDFALKSNLLADTFTLIGLGIPPVTLKRPSSYDKRGNDFVKGQSLYERDIREKVINGLLEIKRASGTGFERVYPTLNSICKYRSLLDDRKYEATHFFNSLLLKTNFTRTVPECPGADVVMV